jgi:transposase
MLSLSPAVKIYLALEPADMRKSVDGLFGLVQGVLQEDPFTGHLFVFHNRLGNRLKILVWDHGGFWVLYKRLEKGRFHFPEASGTSVRIEAAELTLLLGGINLKGARRRPHWSPPKRLEAPQGR